MNPKIARRRGKDMMSHWMAIHKADPENFPRAMSLFTYPPMCSLALTQQQSPSAQLYTSLSAAQKRWRKCKQKSMLQTTKANSAIQSHTRKPSPSSLSWSGAEGVHAPPSIHGPDPGAPCPKSGATICGRRIPGGTAMGINAWVLH